MIDKLERIGSGQLDIWGHQAKEEAKKMEWDDLISNGYLKYIAGYLVDGLSDGTPAEHELTTETDWRGEMKRHLAERGTTGLRSSMVINYVIGQQRAEQHGKA